MLKILKPMNSKRAHYYPLPIYLSILLLVWVGAFFVDVVQMFFDGTLYSSSLVSAEGVRWAVRSALPSICALPWGIVMMLVATYGLLRGSGMMKALLRMVSLRRLTASEWRALFFSFFVAVCYFVLLYVLTESPWGILSGVTEEPALSPLVQGWALLLFVGVLSVSLIYGFIYGNYSSMMDVVVSTGNTFHLFLPAIMALVPASGIVPCLQYAGVHSFLGVSWDWVTAILYLAPFLYILLLEYRNK
jgi:p-aminobenzoyl-glutamate transporter AbgT